MLNDETMSQPYKPNNIWSYFTSKDVRAKVQHHFNCHSLGQQPRITHDSSQCHSKDLNLWPWPLSRCRPRFQFASSGCLLICYLCSEKKREHRDPQSGDWSLIGSYHSLGTCLRLQGIMGNGTFYCFCSNHRFISSFVVLSHPLVLWFPPISYFLFFHSLLLPIRLVFSPSFTPYLNYFPFPLLFHFPPCVSPTPPSSPSSPASYLNCCAHRRTQLSQLPAACIVSTTFIVRSVYKRRTEQ